MASSRGNRPTNAELDILQALWRLKRATVNEVQAELESSRPMGYTTVLKFLQIMLEKGLVIRDESQRSHVYSAKEKAKVTKGTLIADLARRAFGGSTHKLVMQALSAEKLSDEERAEIEALLKQMRGK